MYADDDFRFCAPSSLTTSVKGVQVGANHRELVASAWLGTHMFDCFRHLDVGSSLSAGVARCGSSIPRMFGMFGLASSSCCGLANNLT